MLIDTIPYLLHDPHRPEDVLKVNADEETGDDGDDAYDACRYGVMAYSRKRKAQWGRNVGAFER